MAGWMTSGLASRGRRLLAAAVAIVMGVGFLTASAVLLATAQQGVEDAVAGGLREADLVLTAQAEGISTQVADRIEARDDVHSVLGDAATYSERAGEYFAGASLPAGGATLLSGELPQRSGEIAVNPATADDGVALGDTLTVTGMPAADGTAGPAHEMRVVGVVDPGPVHLLTYGLGFLATDATLRQLDPQLTYRQLVIDVAPGADLDTTRSQIADEAQGASASTGAQAAEEAVTRATGGTAVLGAILLGFAGVALLTAALVIANTFTITLAQRTGELALLRCVGATRAQLRRSVVIEAALLGLIASVVGVLGGVGVAAALRSLGRRVDLGIPLAGGVVVGWPSLVLPVAVGVIVTVLASLWPAVRATRVSPLAALRPAEIAPETLRAGVVRLGAALLLLVAGTGLMVTAASAREVVLGVLGGVVSFVGVLLAGILVVPWLVRALGLGARVAGVPGRLAVAGAVRNPGRAAATSAALLVGVTLITMTSVGAASGERTALGEIDQEYAVDLVAEGPPVEGGSPDELVPSTLPDDLVTRLAEVDGVDAAVAVDTAYLSLGESSGQWDAVAVSPEIAGQVLRSGDLVAQIEPGIVGLDDTDLAINGLSEGDRLQVSGAAGSAELRVVELGVGGGRVTLHPDDLAPLAGDTARQGAVLLRLDEQADLEAAVRGVTDITDDADLRLDGAAGMRAQITQVLDILVLVATALLGVAVLIAVVGIANTLSLSVVERHREHALLRGLGLTRAQMRLMLLVEGVLLALVSAGLGLALGIGYAALGIQTLLPEGTPLVLAVPWGRVGVIVGVALLAGALASVLPARRAARVSPAEGLAAA